MAKKTVEDWSKALREMRQEREDLAAQVAELEADVETVDLSGASDVVTKVRTLQNRREMIEVLDARIPLLSAKVAEMQQAEREAAALALRPLERKAFDAVVDATQAVDVALGELVGVHRELARCSATTLSPAAQIAAGVRSQRDSWYMLGILTREGDGWTRAKKR